MKHIMKFNENKEEIDDIINYIKLVFAEFGDDSEYNIHYTQANTMPHGQQIQLQDGINRVSRIEKISVLYIEIYIPKITNKHDIQSFIDGANTLVDFYSDINVCMKRVNDEYPFVKFYIDSEIEEDDGDGNPDSVLCISCRLENK